jgi:hypothetical protein
MFMLFFGYSLVMINDCFVRPYPRALSITILAVLLFGLISLIISRFDHLFGHSFSFLF